LIGWVDGDVLVYRAAFAAQKKVWFYTDGRDGGIVASFGYKKDATDWLELHPEPEEAVHYALESEYDVQPEDEARFICGHMLRQIKKGLKLKAMEVGITGDGNFREEVAVTKPYKGNRAAEKPIHYEAVREYLLDEWDAHLVEGQEADDWMAIHHMQRYTYNVDDTVIITIDKDLDMVPGRHYNFVEKKKYVITPEEGLLRFAGQLLTGDSTDNIQGAKGYGAAKARRALGDLGPAEALVLVRQVYADLYGDEAEDILDEMATLLWMRQEEGQTWQEGWTKQMEMVT